MAGPTVGGRIGGPRKLPGLPFDLDLEMHKRGLGPTGSLGQKKCCQRGPDGGGERYGCRRSLEME